MEKIKKIIQPVLRVLGYYKIKSKWRWHQFIARLQKEDAQRMAEATAWIEAIDHRLLPELKKTGNVTVSLTTHGKRVADFAPFAIYSIFRQSVLPNRIVLNINRDKWTEESLPELIKKLQIAGLEVNFCKDIGPHTKFLPAMRKYLDDMIITVDDDKYYAADMVESLLKEYKLHTPAGVICRMGRVVGVENGEILPYSQWIGFDNVNRPKGILSPYGVGGVLYPPHIFSEEIFNEAVFRDLCPRADDVWFTVMELKEQIPVYQVSSDFQPDRWVDHKNEYNASNSDALHFYNDESGGNDVQLRKLVEYYRLNDLFKR